MSEGGAIKASRVHAPATAAASCRDTPYKKPYISNRPGFKLWIPPGFPGGAACLNLPASRKFSTLPGGEECDATTGYYIPRK